MDNVYWKFWFFIYFLFNRFIQIEQINVNLALKQYVKQSSNHASYSSSSVVDGVFISLMSTMPSCSHTQETHKPWLVIVLEKVYIIQSIRVLNRFYSYARLSKLYVKTKLYPEKHVTNYDKDFHIFGFMASSLGSSQSKTFISNQPHFAQTILFYLDKRDFLTLCEVEAWSLLYIAKNKPAQQSSLYNPNAPASLAFDGNSNGQYSYSQYKCVHTNNEKNSWWKVDLQKNITVFAVSIIGRVNSVDRLNDISVDLSYTSGTPTITQHPKCGSYPGRFPHYHTMRCKKWTQGRYLSIIETDPNKISYMNMCEVDVFGYYLEKDIEIKTIGYDETTFWNENSKKTSDCSENLREEVEIGRFKRKSLKEIYLKGVGLKDYCEKRIFSLWISENENGKNIKGCELKKTEDGYFSSPDLYDTCYFECEKIKNQTFIHFINLHYKKISFIHPKQIFLLINFS